MSSTAVQRLRRSIRPLEGVAMLGCLLALAVGGADFLQRLQHWQTQSGADLPHASTTLNGAEIPQASTNLHGSSRMRSVAAAPPLPSPTQSTEASPLFTVSTDEPPLPVGDRLAVVPTYSAQGSFLGYEVRGRSGDSRFAHGDIISAINGQAVEDSAAGSELLLIAMAQTSAQIVTRTREPIDR